MPPTARKAAPQEAPGRVKSLYAVAGAGDLALEKLRRVPAGLRQLPAALGRQVGHPYDQLAQRGQKAVARIRRPKTTQQLLDEMDETLRRARSTAGASRRAGERAPRAGETGRTSAVGMTEKLDDE